MKFTIVHGFAGLAMLLACAATSAQQPETPAEPEKPEYPPVYRVEAIVFRHVDGRFDRFRASAPVDYTGHLDPLLTATAHELAEQRLAELARLGPPVAIAGEVDETTPFLQTEDETIRPIPPVYAALGGLAPAAGRAMSRLTDAPQYEPLAARAWIQLAQPHEDTARVRLHDRTVVDRISPPEAATSPLLAEVLPFAPLVEATPPPLEVYRLDGTIRLRQRQFLHLDLDLVWQVPARAPAERAIRGGRPPPVGTAADGAEDEWLLHRLQQSRIVKPGRLEYFDSTLFGVLVRIERFEQVVPEIEQPEPESGLETLETPGQDANEVASADTDSGG